MPYVEYVSTLESTLDSELKAAIADIQAGNYALAMDHVIAAEAALIGIPNSRHGESGFDWNDKSQQIAGLKRQLQAKANSSVGIQQLKVKPKHTTD